MTCFKVRYCQTYVIICAVLMVQSMYLAAGFGIILWFSTGVPPFVSWFINPFKYTVIAIYEYIYIYPDVSMKPSYIGFEEAWLTCLSQKTATEAAIFQLESRKRLAFRWEKLCRLVSVAGKSTMCKWIFLFGEVIYTWGRTSIARVDYSGNLTVCH